MSLLDYPGKVAMVLFASKCNFRCPFCHNRELVLGQDITQLPQDEVLQELQQRQGFIDGVVISGGEPTIHNGLAEFIGKIKETGLAVKLDTNGYKPDVLKELFKEKLLDYVAMDIKTSWGKYSKAAGIEVDCERLKESVELIKASGAQYEFRTTCVPGLVDESDIEEISRLTGEGGLFTLQQFQPKDTLDASYQQITPYLPARLQYFLALARRNSSNCRLIGA